ncbi:hypothetical protein Tco_0760495 [Tanacetum coccineum]
MASMNTRLNIKKLDGNIVQKHGGSKQVGFKQLGPGVETGVHGVNDEKRIWFEVELQGAQRDREAGGFSEVYTAMYEEWGRQTFGCCRVIAAGRVGLRQMKRDTLWLRLRSSAYSWDTVKGTGSVQVLQGVEFEEQHSAHKLLKYREDSNEAAFAVAEAEKIYAHESLTFNNTVACEVISKWKAGLKDDMDARSDVYVLSNGCKKCSDDSDVYYWEYTPDSSYQGFARKSKAKYTWYGDLQGSEWKYSEGVTVQNGKWSCIYAVGSQEYQMVCTRLDIASANVGMLDKFDRGLQRRTGFLWILTTPWVDQSQAAYMTLTEAANEAIWLKRLAIESGFELKIVAGIATGALSKAIPSPRFQHRSAHLSVADGLHLPVITSWLDGLFPYGVIQNHIAD